MSSNHHVYLLIPNQTTNLTLNRLLEKQLRVSSVPNLYRSVRFIPPSSSQKAILPRTPIQSLYCSLVPLKLVNKSKLKVPNNSCPICPTRSKYLLTFIFGFNNTDFSRMAKVLLNHTFLFPKVMNQNRFVLRPTDQ